jgi:hypothetical protein
MKTLRFNLDLVIVALVIGAFVAIAAERLATVPVPEGDEAYMAQVTYEMLYRNKVAVPMMRYLGGNIENAWHSRTPVYFLLMRGFHKLRLRSSPGSRVQPRYGSAYVADGLLPGPPPVRLASGLDSDRPARR